MPKLEPEYLDGDEVLAADGGHLVDAIHDRKKAEDDADLRARGITVPPETLVLKEFKSTILPKAAGTRKVPTWHTDDEARDYWEKRCAEYAPIMQQVTPRDRLRLSYVFGGRMTVAGEVVIDLAAAAKIKIEGLADDD